MSKRIEITVVGQRCVYINDYRVAGGKPYLSENLPCHHHWCTVDDIIDALGAEEVLKSLAKRSIEIAVHPKTS